MQDDQVYHLCRDLFHTLRENRTNLIKDVNNIQEFDDEDIEMYTKMLAITDDTIVKIMAVVAGNGDPELIKKIFDDFTENNRQSL